MQKTLEQMNLKLTEVISSITGRSGIRIIEAILNGQTDPAELAKLASNQCRKSKEEIAQALEGTWDEELMFFLHQYYEQYQFYRRQIEDLDKLIDKILNQIVARVMANNGGEVKDVVRTHGYSRSKNATKVNIEELSVQIWGVNLTNIEGVSQLTVLSLMGELGSNFTRDFENAAHFCSWCNLAPTDKITGGQIKSSRMTPRKNNVGLIFRNCAMSIANSRSPLGDFYRRMRAKGGGIYAVCATAHKLATIVYTMVKTQTEYNPEKVSISDQALIKKRIARYEQMITKLKKQIA
jgi:transposase